MPIDANHLFGALQDAGIRDFAGVPCSILDPLTSIAAGHGQYVAAAVEGEALCIAAGAWLAGGQSAILLQNSGLGNTINPLGSLLVPYQIPVLLIVSWRGEPGRPDAVHHYPMGEATPGLLDLFKVPRWVLRENSDVDQIVAEARSALAQRLPAALIVPRGVFGKAAKPAWKCLPSGAASMAPEPCFSGHELPTRTEVIQAFTEHCGEFAAISTTGYTSRELASRGPRANHFYMQGSMGFASAIALGVAHRFPQAPVFILDGDGALIMRLGSLATIGALQPPNLVHLVLDNGTYASTGGQPTAAPNVDFTAVARACGYRRTAKCLGREGLQDALQWARNSSSEGATLVHIRISADEGTAQERPEQSPEQIATAFRHWWTGLHSAAAGIAKPISARQ